MYIIVFCNINYSSVSSILFHYNKPIDDGIYCMHFFSLTGPGDHNLTTGFYTLEFLAGSTTSNALVINIDDEVFELTNERFSVRITEIMTRGSNLPANDISQERNTTLVTIEDDEIITILFRNDTYFYSENDGHVMVAADAMFPQKGISPFIMSRLEITFNVDANNGTAYSMRFISIMFNNFLLFENYLCVCMCVCVCVCVCVYVCMYYYYQI